jgi:RNA polymerase sigma factor (sigma-70 family)
MPGRRVAVLRSFGDLLRSGRISGLDDGQLLERFATRRDEAAFAALVALHGPMVLGVCRRILREGHDVEDAFQATFLVLVRRAGSIHDPGRLGPWLHGVARRVSMRARAQAARRREHRGLVGPPDIAEEDSMRPASPAEGVDVLEVIDEEVARLPAPYRQALVLCAAGAAPGVVMSGGPPSRPRSAAAPGSASSFLLDQSRVRQRGGHA